MALECTKDHQPKDPVPYLTASGGWKGIATRLGTPRRGASSRPPRGVAGRGISRSRRSQIIFLFVLSSGAAQPLPRTTAMPDATVTTAKKRGPNTPEGKARSAMNAVKHGLRARDFALLPEEDPEEWRQHVLDLSRATGRSTPPRRSWSTRSPPRCGRRSAPTASRPRCSPTSRRAARPLSRQRPAGAGPRGGAHHGAPLPGQRRHGHPPRPARLPRAPQGQAAGLILTARTREPERERHERNSRASTNEPGHPVPRSDLGGPSERKPDRHQRTDATNRTNEFRAGTNEPKRRTARSGGRVEQIAAERGEAVPVDRDHGHAVADRDRGDLAVEGRRQVAAALAVAGEARPDAGGLGVERQDAPGEQRRELAMARLGWSDAPGGAPVTAAAPGC